MVVCDSIDASIKKALSLHKIIRDILDLRILFRFAYW